MVEDIEAEVKAQRKGHAESSSSSARAPPPPEATRGYVAEDDAPRMLVFERPQSWNKAKVEAVFSEYGKVELVKLGEVPRVLAGRKLMQRAAAVTFCRLEDAQAACHRMNRVEVDGIILDIKMKPPRASKSSSAASSGSKGQPGSFKEADGDSFIDLQRAGSFRSSSLNSGRSSPSRTEERLRSNGARHDHSPPPLRASRPPPPPMPASIPPPPLPSDGKNGGYPTRSSGSRNMSTPAALGRPPPPKAEKADSARMLVLERPRSWNRSRVEELFSQYGEVENIKLGEAQRIVAGKRVMQRAAAVTFGRFEDAKVARQQLHGQEFDGLTLNIKMKQPSAIKKTAGGGPAGSNGDAAKAAAVPSDGADSRADRGRSSPPRRSSGTSERRELEHLGLSVCAKAASKAQASTASSAASTDLSRRGGAINARSVVIRNLPPECCSFAWFVHQFPHIKVLGAIVSEETAAGSRWAIVDCEKASDAHLLKSDIMQKCFTDTPVMAKVVDSLDRVRSAQQLRRNDERMSSGPRRPGLHSGRPRHPGSLAGRSSLVRDPASLLLRRRAAASRRLLAPARAKDLSRREERHVRRTTLTRVSASGKKRPASESPERPERAKRPLTSAVNGSPRMA